jgi:hypothetical protein
MDSAASSFLVSLAGTGFSVCLLAIVIRLKNRPR